ncbi:unnamed protein product, partial [Brenthis ino]
MYGCTPGGPGFESGGRAKFCYGVFLYSKLSNSRSWEVDGVSLPCLGEHVKPSVLRLNSHWSCRMVVPPEYESDRNRECTLCLRVHLCTIISPAQLASLNEIGRRERNRSGEHQSISPIDAALGIQFDAFDNSFMTQLSSENHRNIPKNGKYRNNLTYLTTLL